LGCLILPDRIGHLRIGKMSFGLMRQVCSLEELEEEGGAGEKKTRLIMTM
jgi:hypothetical protein